MKVAVIYGGSSAERDVSINTGEAVLKACLENNFNANAVVIEDENDKFFDTPKKILQQHYKEIVCTNYYLDSFLEKIKNKIDNLEILLVSDTGTKTEDNDETKYLRDNYSVLFAIKNNVILLIHQEHLL